LKDNDKHTALVVILSRVKIEEGADPHLGEPIKKGST
jgi:hypothetical protein